MKYNSHARQIIQTLYRYLRNNFISDFFSCHEEPSQLTASINLSIPSTSLKCKNSINKEDCLNSQINLSLKTANLDKLDQMGLSSNGSLSSFTLGNNSSLYLGSQSNLSHSKRVQIFNKFKTSNPWEIIDEKSIFHPIKNSFYQKYVLRYTRFRPKLNRDKRNKKKYL
jgi:hypothetical protein